MRSIIILASYLSLAVVLCIPPLYALRTGRRGRTMFWSALLFFLWYFIDAFVAMPIAYRYDRSLADLFCEGPGLWHRYSPDQSTASLPLRFFLLLAVF